MKILIGGEDEIAFRLAEALMLDHDVVFVAPSSVGTARLEHYDVEAIYGPLTSTETLDEARVAESDLFIACTGSDAGNLVACVAARRMGAGRTVCFLFRRDLHEHAPGRMSLAESLGIDHVVRPAEQLAEDILQIVTVPGALDVEAFAGGRVRLLKHRVEPDARITQSQLKNISVPSGVVLVMGRRDGTMFIPSGETRFEPGDTVTAMGTPQGINRLLFRYLRSPAHRADPHSATIVGGGMVGLGVALGLEEAGWSVKVIENKKDRCEQIAPLIQGLVLRGDGADKSLLEEESVAEDAVIIVVTSNDEKNLLVSLMARELGVPRIVTRADKLDHERLFEKVGIDVIRSASGSAIQSVVRGIVHGRQELLMELDHGDAEVLQLTLRDDLPPTPLYSIKRPVFAIVGAIVRERKVIIPRGTDELRAGDQIFVFCTPDDEAAARQFFLEEIGREKKA